MQNWTFVFRWRPVSQKKPVNAPVGWWWAKPAPHGFGSNCHMYQKILHCIQVLLKWKILGVTSLHFSLLHSDVKAAGSTGSKAYFPHKLWPLLECLSPWIYLEDGDWVASSYKVLSVINFSLIKVVLFSRQIWALCWMRQRACVCTEVLSVFPISTVNSYHSMQKLCHQMLPDPPSSGRGAWLLTISINKRSAHTWIPFVYHDNVVQVSLRVTVMIINEEWRYQGTSKKQLYGSTVGRGGK